MSSLRARARLWVWRWRAGRRRLPAESMVACVACGRVERADAMIGRPSLCIPPRRRDAALCGICYGQAHAW